MGLDYIISETFKTYFKNIIVNLFFSALILLLPYLQYVMIQNGSSYITAFALTFITAFVSVALVYAPFIVSVHKARITELWRVLLRDVLTLAAWWSAIYAALFTAFLCAPSFGVIAAVVYILLAFLLWVVMVICVSHIVCSAASQDSAQASLWGIVNRDKSGLIKLMLLGIVALACVPITWGMKKTRNLHFHPHIENPTGNELMGDLVLSANELTALLLFFLFPVLTISIYKYYHLAKVNMNNTHRD